MLNGLIELPIWGYIVVALVFTHITIASVTIFLHRSQAHRAVELHPIVSHFFRFWLWLTTGMVTKQWVAIHRKHHAKCETKDDPHSPMIEGINKVMWEGAELYRIESRNQETLDNYGHNTPDDWMERKLYSGRTNKLGIAIMFLINVLLFGPIGITIWAVQMLWIPFWAAGMINGMGHYWGYRNFEVNDTSTNLTPIGIIIGGEELHNNHHAFGSSAKFSVNWWEFDIGWMYIKLMSYLGLAKVKKLAPRPVIDKSKNVLDKDTVVALVTNRFSVMSNYARQVMKRVYKDEVSTADSAHRDMLKRAKDLLSKDDILIDDASRQELDKVLAESNTLQTVYAFRKQLQEIWMKTAANNEQLLQALQEWCQRAEATGIKALQDFADSLKNYSMAPKAV
jgi:stearoyl-CoA desaturase (delta-9 desaturase)